MKKLISFMSIIAIVAISNCSEIPENNDPILGIWVRTIPESESKSTITKEEWIFNDVYLGRYQQYSGSKIEFYTDFSWEENENIYTIKYYGTDIPEAKVMLTTSTSSDILEYTDGDIFATRIK